MKLAIVNGEVVTAQGVLAGGLVVAEDGRIKYVGPQEGGELTEGSEILDAAGMRVFPGLIDTHVHGSYGDDVMLSGPEGIRRISKALLRYGCTSYLPSTVSSRHEDLLQALEWCVQARENTDPSAEIIGVHIEGPFINMNKKGAQPPEGIRDPDTDQCREYLQAAPGMVKVMTLAPELPGAFDLMKVLKEAGVAISLGHTDADYDTALAAMEAGAARATHLFNAMPSLHHRKPGLTAAVLTEPGIRAEVVADGVHVDPRMVRLAAQARGKDSLILITDAMSAVGCPDGLYTLGKNPVVVKGDLCLLTDGVTIASSMLTMNRAVGNFIRFTGASLVEAAYSASLLPAQECGVAGRKGSLEPGKDADIAVLNEDFSVFATIRAGEIAYRMDG